MSKEKINSKTITCSRITESITLRSEARESQIYQRIQLYVGFIHGCHGLQLLQPTD